MTLPGTNNKCIYSRHSGPVGCLPAPNIFPLAKETFAKGKMFWNPRPAARLTWILIECRDFIDYDYIIPAKME